MSVPLLPPPLPLFTSTSSRSPSSTLLPSSSPYHTTTSSPTPLSPALIALVLDYICPPSQLSSSLPPHLISSSLLQRHHFLHLLPDDPASYLAWPSDSDSHTSAIRLLEAFQKPLEDVLYSTFPICYSADAESTYAHVAISPDHTPGLRLVFQWNPPEGWKYHNIALMPFPPENLDPLDALLFQSPIFSNEATMNVANDDNESYWDAYGADESDNPTLFATTKDNSLGSTEDAYWAQYAEVHGSGDSTLPSPLPLKQKRDSPERVIIAYTGSNPSSVYNPLEPPSPNTLVRRLKDLSPRFPSPPLVDDSSDSAFASNPLTTPSAALSTRVTSVASDSSPHELTLDAPVGPQLVGMMSQSTESCEALKDTIRGVYRLWRNGRPSRPHLEDEEEEFLNIVRQAMVEHPQP